MPFNGKSVDLSKVVPLIDEMMTLLKMEQGEDDGKKVYGIRSLSQTERGQGSDSSSLGLQE